MLRSLVGVALVALLSLAPSAGHRTIRQGGASGVPGQFDFYVLVAVVVAVVLRRGRRTARRPLAVAAMRGRGPIRSSCTGCGRNMTKAFPNIARMPSPRLYRGIVSSMLDLMPAPHLIYNEWDKHGTCSGLSARAYFDTVRKARAAVKIPPEYSDLKTPLISRTRAPWRMLSSRPIPGFTPSGMAIECDSKTPDRSSAVSVQGGRGLRNGAVSRLPRVVKRSCRRDQVVMPPVRGG